MSEREQVIYLDNNATTRIDPVVLEEMLPFLTHDYGNPSSAYGFGAQVRDAIELARERVAALIGSTPGEIVFTSGGTEANNAALNSAVQLQPTRRHIVTTAVEHSSTLRHCEHLAKEGYEVTAVGVSRDGGISLDALREAIRPETLFVSVMWANNETGVIFPIEEIAAIAREKRVLFHTDAIQAAGKLPIAVRDLSVSSLSLSAHKVHGPKGVGALYANRRSAFRPTFFGGNQENNRRAGTENVAGIVGFGKAADLARNSLAGTPSIVRNLRDAFETEIVHRIPQTSVNGDVADRLPNTTSIAFAGIEAEAALLMLDRHGICCSAGSACRSDSPEPSHVLVAMGLTPEEARSSLRFSFSRFNTGAELATLTQTLVEVVARLREFAPTFPVTSGEQR